MSGSGSGSGDAAHNQKLINLIQYRIEDDYHITEADELAGARNLYYFSSRAKGRISVFLPDGQKLVEIYPFCYCRCIKKQDKTWFYNIKYEIFLASVPAFSLYPYMAQPQIMITITNLDKNSKIIKDMRGASIHTLNRINEDITLFNNGRDEQQLEWVITRKLEPICYDYDDVIDEEKMSEILERTPSKVSNIDLDEEAAQVEKSDF